MKLQDPENFFRGLAATLVVLAVYLLFIAGILWVWAQPDWGILSRIMATLMLASAICILTAFIAAVHKSIKRGKDEKL